MSAANAEDRHDQLSKAQLDAIGVAKEEPAFLPSPVLDQLIESVIALGGELWVERERRRRLELLLEAQGLIDAEQLNAQELDAEAKELAQTELAQFVQRTLGPLKSLK